MLAGVWLPHVWIEPLWNWNHGTRWYRCAKDVVWIEPLWNWNSSLNGGVVVAQCLNWTFMELKYGYTSLTENSSSVWIEPLWNWNNSEQKNKKQYHVWIEPLWNWNYHNIKVYDKSEVFELNLYGIEIFNAAEAEKSRQLFELNLYGIEIVDIVTNVFNILLFELNLYGIEIY